MNRRAAFALFILSLSTLPACVTKGVEPTPSTASAEIRRTRFGEIVKLNFGELSRTFAYARVGRSGQSDDRLEEDWRFAQEVCSDLDTGMSPNEWAKSQGLPVAGIDPENFKVEEAISFGLASVAVKVICPEYTLAWEDVYELPS